jgi:ubiquinone biosynthesis protein COQ9
VLEAPSLLDDAPLHRFAHDLMRHAEEALGFNSGELEQSAVSDARRALVNALNEQKDR